MAMAKKKEKPAAKKVRDLPARTTDRDKAGNVKGGMPQGPPNRSYPNRPQT